MAQILRTILALFALFTSLASAVAPITVQGSDFVNSANGDRFQIIGVDYQPGGQAAYDDGSGIDALSNSTACLRDAVLMQRLGINTIRIYNLDPTLDHNECASIFNAAGIYMILDVNSPLPNESLNRGDPASSYNSQYLERVFAMVEAFKGFPNLLSFFSGNEVINEGSTVDVPAYLRAVTRDLKDYISKQADRQIPVGYSAADVRPILEATFAYLSCNIASSPTSKIDFFGLNSYSWCGNSSFTESGYDVLLSQFSNTTIPVFFSEYGCNIVSPRLFKEVPVLYGEQMTTVLSGGLVYEFSEEVSNYGLVSYNANNTVSILQDYDNLQAQYKSLNYTLLESHNTTASSLTPPTCDSSLISTSAFLNTFDIPARAAGVDDMINNGISNPNQGKLVDVNDVDVNETVYASNGNVITGLKLIKLPDDSSNTAGSNDSGSVSTASSSSSGTGTSATTSPSATATRKGAATRNGSAKNAQYVVGVLGLALLMGL